MSGAVANKHGLGVTETWQRHPHVRHASRIGAKCKQAHYGAVLQQLTPPSRPRALRTLCVRAPQFEFVSNEHINRDTEAAVEWICRDETRTPELR